jgi:hypothetical protein
MKSAKTLLLIAFLSLAISSSAQKAEIGLSGGIGTTWLMNKNVFDYGDKLDPVVSVGGNYGIAATFYFTEKVGLGIELNNSIMNQKYKGVVGTTSFDSKTKLTYLDFPLLLKLKSGKSGFYFEIGPKLSYLASASEDYNTSISVITLNSGGGVKSDFNATVISGVVGVGGRINIVDALTLSFGLRLAGGITDATKEYSLSNLSANTSVSGSAANVAADGSLDYKRTTLASGGLQIGVLYRIGK